MEKNYTTGSLGRFALLVGLCVSLAAASPAGAVPNAKGDSYATVDAAPIVVTDPALGVLGNDDNPLSGTLTAWLITAPSHGTLALATDGTFTYTPYADASGTDSFTYLVDDGDGDAFGLVTLTLQVTMAPAPAISPMPGDFGDCHPSRGACGWLDFTVRNVGSEPVPITGTGISEGADEFAIQSDGCTGKLLMPLPLNADLSGVTLSQWPSALYGNDHWYMAVPVQPGPQGMTWEQANTAATLAGGYLPTATSSAESDFIFSLVRDNSQFWFKDGRSIPCNHGPWLGAIQVAGSPYPQIGWNWVTAEYFGFTNWHATEPNDAFGNLEETRLHLQYCDNDTPAASTWGDAPHTGESLGLIIEFDTAPTAVPSCIARAEFTPSRLGAAQATLSLFAGSGPIAQVDLAGTGVNIPPVAGDDPYFGSPYPLNEDEPLVVDGSNYYTYPGLLINDDDYPDFDPLTSVLVAGPSHGTVTVAADGSFTYVPAAEYSGPDSFTYRACDPWECSAPATASLQVNAVNDAPVALDDAVTLLHDTGVDIPVLANDTDADGPAPLFVWIRSQPAHGSARPNTDGSVQYIPDPGYTGSDTFTYVAMDGLEGESQTATVAITVAAAPPRLTLLANGGAAADVLSGERLAVTLALDCGDWCGTKADWWVWADTPSGPISWSFSGGAWSPGVNPAVQGPLGALAGTVVFESDALVDGDYRFHFSLDAPDGARDLSPAWSSAADVRAGGGFYEDFEDGTAERFVPDVQRSWKVAALGSASREHGLRVYRLKAGGSQQVFLSRSVASYADFSFAADVRLAGGGKESSSRGVGLVFRAGKSYGNGYVFHINARGFGFIFKRVGGATRRLGAEPLRWFRSDAIRTGKGAWNRLEVECAGDQLTFKINGKVVREARDVRFQLGRVGLKAFGDGANGERVEFDNVTLRVAPAI